MASGSRHFVNPGDEIWSFVEALASDEKLSLYDLVRPRANLLKVFVDKEKVEENRRGLGVSSDDCVILCRRLMHALVVEGPKLGLGTEPELEVSSPGLDRELRLKNHFKESVGSKVKLWVEDGVLIGVLDACDGENLVFRPEAGEETMTLCFSDVRKAHILF